MKKSLLAIGLTLTMVLAMATPAFAAGNANGDGTTDVTKPGHPVYGVDNTQAAGESYNAATVESKDGTTWQVANDDDKNATAVDTAADINVWAKVVDSGTKIYKVDLAWGAMKFEFKDSSGQWNTTSHSYDSTGGGTAAWTTTYLDGTNNKVAVTNHSNNAIDATFAFDMFGTTFNLTGGVNNVDNNFFADNTKALAAALVLTNTFSDAAGNLNPSAVADKLPGSKVALATADAYNSTAGTGAAADGTKNVVAGARTDDVFFAFSGTPDKGRGAVLDTFTKVGVITVTVTPNNDVPLNRPAYTTPSP